jgi:hypothetical protein
MQDTKAFEPFYQVSQTATAGSLRSSVTVAATAGAAVASSAFQGGLSNDPQQIQVANLNTTAWAYVNFGVIRDALTVNAATSATGLPVPPNSTRVFTVHPEVNGASVILSAGAGPVIFTRGSGK